MNGVAFRLLKSAAEVDADCMNAEFYTLPKDKERLRALLDSGFV